ncbi:3-octaprenyl-4-hydroxybenzoate carboxy-lyase [Rickettsiales bacterium Ac37b]|nr:3-octaprenyl-4-hydroxybenzoate carboxy-lyase [Rickettsiales bacterium Ac37b]
MPYESLRDFISFLEQEKDLVRVNTQVSTVLEMTEIQTRLLASGGPAVLFENVVTENGINNIPVLVNLFGTVKRVAAGIDSSIEKLKEVGELLAFLRQPEPPGGWQELVNVLPILKKVLASRPKNVNNAPCQEKVLLGDEIDLSLLPIQTCWPNEPAPLITWPLVVTKDSPGHQEEKYNLGIYRMQVIGKNKTIMRWLKHRGGAAHSRSWAKQHKKMPAAVVIGADPATIIAAVTPIPDNVSEYQFAGLLRGKRLKLVDCKTVPIKVPANAEIILEGYIDLETYHDEGPYGDHTGYYNDVEQFPEFNITAITMRKSPIYLSTFTGRPPDEPSILGEVLNEVFIPLIKQQFSEIVDFWLPPEGCSYRIAVVSIKKEYPGQARRVMMGVWGFLRQFMYTKWIIVVDADINCRDWKDVMWAVATKVDPVRDLSIIDNTPIDYLDFASEEAWLGSKIGIDATDKIYPETKRNWGKKIKMDIDVIEKVTAKWKEYGFHGA